jgi:hypothetical protein
MKDHHKSHQIRQGDVFLLPVKSLPPRCKPIEPENGLRFVLAHGEVTGHAHAIYEFTPDMQAEVSANKAIQQAQSTAEAQTVIERVRKLRTVQMWESQDGEWYLEVRQLSTMRHEEHTAPKLPIGIYWAPIQVQENVANTPTRVAD